jgi:hypothetical protein
MVHYSSLLLSPPSVVRPFILLPRDPGSGTHPEHPLMRSCMFSTVKCKYRYSMNSPYYTRWFDPLMLTIQHTVVYFYPQWAGFWLAKVEVERRRSDQMGKRLCRGQGCVGVCRPVHTATNHLMNKYPLKYCRRYSQGTHLRLKLPVFFSKAQIHWVY